MSKLICVVGATGNQGGSVARRFHKAGFRVRALCRNPESPAALKLKEDAPGIEVVAVDLNDVSTLIPAFKGANVIFSVTQYWEPFMRPDYREKAREQGITCRRIAYDVEYLHGKNIVDAAATTLDTLESFLASTLSHAGKASGGKITELYHFDAKADIFPTYVEEKYPELAAKLSCIHTGYFYTSYNILPSAYFSKLEDGSFQMAFTTDPDKLVPHFTPVDDMGNFTYAVYQMPPGKAYMAAGTTCSWSEWIETWGKVVGVKTSYKQVTPEELIASVEDEDLGIEITHMFNYTSEPGYDGGYDLLTAKDIEEAGIECPMTTWEEWAKKNDWSTVLSK
ncbi:Uncharacterized protein SAPIO_CDS6478 [Scedosporium apiospermum]|uniref:NmrA-like domain-containing protein n=1 Tax=Pseudallescheria apiosperma TaxID=563466 RepID=A0A084G3Z9_PSEDA|nr:Uncharacterized protein SAPIO_CDS6478 [Scedosporium apiospermum]KEZ42061.1 Uncharacterized protein SAPIO_CDS6478 [Scedosporium apiospermum]